MAVDDTPGEEQIQMNLTIDEGMLFYDLYAGLLSFVNRKLKVSSEQFLGSREYTSTPLAARVAIRDALFTHRELIDEFVRMNPAKLKADELEIVSTWKQALLDKFFVFRYLRKYTVFLTSGGAPKNAYGVLGLADPLEEVIGPRLPRLVTTALLPFQGRIIYDGLASGYNITFGGGVKRRLNEEYKEAKEAFGIITSLGDEAAGLPEKPKKSKKRPPKATAVVGGRSARGLFPTSRQIGLRWVRNHPDAKRNMPCYSERAGTCSPPLERTGRMWHDTQQQPKWRNWQTR